MDLKINLSDEEIFTKANELTKKKDFISAKKLYLEVIKKDPQNIKALNNTGIIHLNIGKFKDAIKFFKKCVEIDDSYKDGYNNLGLAYKSIKNYSRALNSFTKCIKIDPKYFQAYNNIGQVYYEIGKYEEAIINFKTAIKINTNLYFAYNNIGQTYIKKGEFNEAIINFKKAIKLNPNYFEVYKNIGQVFFECGEYNNALISFTNAIKLNPKKHEIYCLIGLTYEKLGNVELALKNYKNVSKKDLNFQFAQFNYASLLYKNKQFREALNAFKSINYNKSSSYLLKCLYELDSKKDFQDELDKEINNGTANAIIGSLINSSNLKFGTKKRNTFCENPLNYVLNINLKKEYDFEKIFVNTTNNFFNDQLVKDRPQPLLINGSQSAGNFFNYKNDSVSKIKNIIHKYLKTYHDTHKENEDGIIKNWPKNFELIGWLVKMNNGGSIKPHIHDHGWLSGSIYINVPKKLNNDGNLVISISDEKKLIESDDYSKNKKIINVETGSFCLFPSSLFHYTIPFKSDEERIVLAFDVISK